MSTIRMDTLRRVDEAEADSTKRLGAYALSVEIREWFERQGEGPVPDNIRDLAGRLGAALSARVASSEGSRKDGD